ncbi:MAG: sporulation initiation factor Spo0A C-terminal domain-containing protein [Clostridia bacterium]
MRRVLNRLGINSSVFGFMYIEFAVSLVLNDRNVASHVTTRIYPVIANHYNVTPASVERAIRYAINNCWERGNRRLLNDIAGRELKEKPYTREFIAMLADYEQMQQYLLATQSKELPMNTCVVCGMDVICGEREAHAL